MKQLLFTWLFISSCGKINADYACTTEIVSYYVLIIDKAGAPVDSLDVKITNKDTGYEYYSYKGFPFLGKKRYLLMDDQYFSILKRDGDQILFKASNDSTLIEQEYEFGKDACHVIKLAGPDTIKLSI